ncbi:MAG: penicillin-binding protein [Candidatus Binatia bacterium]
MRSRNRFSMRLGFIASCFAIAVPVIATRMFSLSVREGEGRAQQAKDMTCRDTDRISYRGRIADRNGVTLAASLSTRSLSRSSSKYTYDKSHASLLAPILGMDVDKVDGVLRSRPGHFAWLVRRVAIDVAVAVSRLGIGGLEIHTAETEIQKRTYPQGALASHVIGFTNSYAKGLEGIERVFDDEIRGRPVTVRVCRDIKGRPFYNESDLAGVNWGATVELTIDSNLQGIAEQELARAVAEFGAEGGSVVAIDPRSGDILAMANYPGFDPNTYYSASPDDVRNRAITDNFEPGSTMKPFLIAAALELGVVSEEDVFFCEEGSWRFGGRTIHDHHGHGDLTVPEILRYSSNICSAKIGALVGAEHFHKYLSWFGFGRPTGITLPGERQGQLLPPERWRDIRLATVSYGQGIGVTALQLAAAYSVLANDGVRMKPHIVRQAVDSDGTLLFRNVPEQENRVVSYEVARKVSSMLEGVVADGGTAPRARIDGVRVAGKTGTAQQAAEGGGGYIRGKWVASFVGYLPVEDPRIVIAVTVSEPKSNHYGGVVAAPVFRRVAEASLDYLHIRRHVPVPERPVVIQASPPPVVAKKQQPFSGNMPNLVGLSLRSAMRALEGCNCDIQVDGAGYVAAQNPRAGKKLTQMAAVELELAPGPRR